MSTRSEQRPPRPASRVIDKNIREIWKPTSPPLWWRRVYFLQMKINGRRGGQEFKTVGAAELARDDWRANGIPIRDVPPVDAIIKKADEEATLADVITDYVAYLTKHAKPLVGRDGLRDLKRPPNVKNAYSLLAILRRHAPALLTKPAAEISAADLFALRRAREEAKKKPSSIARELGTLRAALRKAFGKKYEFPEKLIPTQNNLRVRKLQPEVLKRLLKATPKAYKAFFELQALSGLRQGEVRTLRVDAIEFELGRVVLGDSKEGPDARTLSDDALDLLRRHLKTLPAGAVYAFPNRRGRPHPDTNVWRAFRTAADSVGLHTFTNHDLRHHATSVAISQPGAELSHVMQFGGWKDPRSMLRYAHVDNDMLRKLANGIATYNRGDQAPPLRAVGRSKRRTPARRATRRRAA